MRLIGVDKEKNKIFVYIPLKLSSFSLSTTLSTSTNLWHVRLGHPSDFVVNKLLGHSYFLKVFVINLAIFVYVLNKLEMCFL